MFSRGSKTGYKLTGLLNLHKRTHFVQQGCGSMTFCFITRQNIYACYTDSCALDKISTSLRLFLVNAHAFSSKALVLTPRFGSIGVTSRMKSMRIQMDFLLETG